MPDLFPEDIDKMKEELVAKVYERTALVVEMSETTRSYRDAKRKLDEQIEQLAAAIFEGEK